MDRQWKIKTDKIATPEQEKLARLIDIVEEQGKVLQSVVSTVEAIGIALLQVVGEKTHVEFPECYGD